MIVPLGYLIIRSEKKFLSGLLGYLGDRGVARSLVSRVQPRALALEERVYGFYAKSQRSFISIFALDSCFHLAGVLEVYVTLSFISPEPPTITQAFILESVNRIINVAFKFIPLRAGVDEGGTGQVSKVLGFAKGIGEALAIVRKGRDIFWVTVGVLLIWKRGFSLRGLNESGRLDPARPKKYCRSGRVGLPPLLGQRGQAALPNLYNHSSGLIPFLAGC